MAQLTSYLFFDGTCADAMRFYESALGGKLHALIRYADMPGSEKMTGEGSARIAHAYLTFDGGALMASDFPPGDKAEKAGAFSLAISVPEVADAQRLFDVLSEGGNVKLPISKTSWAEAFGMLDDRYGTPWMISGGQTNG
jgi:PhnB protein